MTEIPGDTSNVDAQLIPVEQVQLGSSLLVDRGQGTETVRVENVRFRSIQGADGSWVGTYLMVVRPVNGGPSWDIEFIAGAQISLIAGPAPSDLD